MCREEIDLAGPEIVHPFLRYAEPGRGVPFVDPPAIEKVLKLQGELCAYREIAEDGLGNMVGIRVPGVLVSVERERLRHAVSLEQVHVGRIGGTEAGPGIDPDPLGNDMVRE